MMRTTTSSGEGIIVTLSSGAGRLLFALLLSDDAELYKVANVSRKAMPQYIAELLQTPNPVDKGPETLTSHSIPHWSDKEPETKYLDLDTEDQVEAACTKADRIEEPVARGRAQALAVVEAWKFLFPSVNKVQELRPEKAKEWVKAAGSAATVYGWMGEVEDAKLAAMNFPLAYVNKKIMGKAEDAKAVVKEHEQDEEEVGVMDAWRTYAQKLVVDHTGGTNHGSKDRKANLQRITSTVGGSAGST